MNNVIEKDIMKNCVYRFLNKENEIIYIGKATQLKNRLNSHNHLDSECYDSVNKIEFTSFATKDDMDLAERYLISKHKPRYNVVFKSKEITVNIDDFENLSWNEYDKATNKPVAIQYYNNTYTPDLISRYNSYSEKLNDLKEEQLKCKIEIDTLEGFSNVPEVQELIDFKYKSMDSLKLKYNNCSRELIRLRLGNEKYDKLEPWKKDLFIKYDTIDEKEIINHNIIEIVNSVSSLMKFSIKGVGYFDSVRILCIIADSFSYTVNSEWLCLIDKDVLTRDFTFKKREIENISYYVDLVYNKAKLKTSLDLDKALIDDIIFEERSINMLSSVKCSQPVKVVKVK